MLTKTIYLLLLLLLTLISSKSTIEENSDLFTISTTFFEMYVGESKNLTLSINLKTSLEINFSNTIMIGVDLDQEDNTFTSKIYSLETSQDTDTYILIINSTTIGKNSFTITLYDYESQKIYPLTVVNFTVLNPDEKEILPDPSKTKIIQNPSDSIMENDTIVLEFQLFDKDDNILKLQEKDLSKLKVYVNDEEISDFDIFINEDGNYVIKYNPENYGLSQKVNVYYVDGDNKIKLFEKDFEYEIILYPFYLRTEVECLNCENITIGEKLNMSLYLYNYKGLCVEKGDFSNLFKILIIGPIEDDTKASTKSYKFHKVYDANSKCQNKYEIFIEEDDDLYTSVGIYEIDVYQKDIIIYSQIQKVLGNSSLPDPSKTKLIKSPLPSISENETVDLELQLFDENGNILKVKEDYLKVYINGKPISNVNITLNDDGIYSIECDPDEFGGKSQKLNVYYDDGKTNYTLFKDDLEYELILYPHYLKTRLNCFNCKIIYIGDKLNMSLYLYNYNNLCVEGLDFSERFIIEVKGPIENNKTLSKTYMVKQEYDDNLDCQNKYVVIFDESPYITEGTYELSVYQNRYIIYNIIQKVVDSSVPGPTKTEIVTPPKSYIDENDTVTLELKLFDKNGNPLKNKTNYIDKLTVYINDEPVPDASIELEEDGQTFKFSTKPADTRYQKINVIFNNSNIEIPLLENDLEYRVTFYPFYLNTIISCSNCQNITIGEKLNMILYLYNYKKVCVEDDFSKFLSLVIIGPLENSRENQDSKYYFFNHTIDLSLPCNNKYELSNDVIYELEGTYELILIQNDLIIYDINQTVINNVTTCNSEISTLNQIQNENSILGEKITISLKCSDKFGNKLKSGGENFTAYGFYESNGKYTTFELEIKDNENGEYIFSFLPSNSLEYTIIIYQNNNLFKETIIKYGSANCDENYPIFCPNKNKCVKNKYDCLDNNNCPNEKPFYCKKNNNYTCVESQTECDCPENYIKCGFMNYCVPENRKDMCPDNLISNVNICSIFKNFPQLCVDGICRKSLELEPTQKVCPIGNVLCADLSCRKNYDECFVSEKCKENQIRCIDQTCVDDVSDCPSTVSCGQSGNYVCPDNKCVSNEIECDALPVCNEDKPYRCHDNNCANEQKNCIKSVSCGHKMALCSDLICRTSC